MTKTRSRFTQEHFARAKNELLHLGSECTVGPGSITSNSASRSRTEAAAERCVPGRASAIKWGFVPI